MNRRTRLVDDEGSVLIAVVGIMVVITVLAIGAFWMADDGLFQSKQARSRAQALAVAEAGLDQALWRLKIGQPPTSTLVIDLPTGRCTIEPTQTSVYTWRLIARGSTNTTPSVTRSISTEVFSLSIWDMVFCDGPAHVGGNLHINGNATFKGMWYMRGDFPPTNGNAKFDRGPFFVKDGDIDLTVNGGSASIGELERPRVYCNGTVNPTRVYADIFTDVPDIEAPKQDESELNKKRVTAMQESMDDEQGNTGVGNKETRTSGITTGLPTPRTGWYKIVDNNDSASDRSVTSLTLGQGQPSFGKPWGDADGADDFSWDATNGVLTVQGTVYIDARDLYIHDVKYAGKGTIVCSGNVHITDQWEPLSGRATFPAGDVVGISATGDIDENVYYCYGTFFSGTSFEMLYNNNGQFYGTVVAPDVTFGMHADIVVVPMSQNLPPSMPLGGSNVVVASGWHEGTGANAPK